jgi:aminopeptidase-like protein/methionyl-tRNA formyltransferase/aminoglycoside N3'-acetyltransferase/acyl carrier protein
MAYTYNDVQVALEEANILPGDTVFLHSSLLDLGKMKDVAPEAAAGKVADAIIDYIGPGGTLVVPAFSWEFYRGHMYSVEDTPCEPDMGILNEHIRKRPIASRSRHPGQSLVCIGKLAKELTDESLDYRSAWDKKGPIGVMEANNAKTIMLGPPKWGTCSIIHYVEEELNVPYRYWKTFTGDYKKPGGDGYETKTYSFFARQLEPFEWDTCMDPVGSLLQDAHVLNHSKLGKGALIAFAWKDMIPLLRAKLIADPYFVAVAKPGVPKTLDDASSNIDVSIPANVFKKWVKGLSNEVKNELGLLKSVGDDSEVEVRVKSILKKILKPEFVQEVERQSSLLDGGLDSVSFLSLVENLNEEFRTDITDMVDSLQSLTIYGSLIDVCKRADDSNNKDINNDEEKTTEMLEKEAEEEALLEADVSNADPLRLVLIGVGNPLHTLLDKISNSPLYEKIEILVIFSSTNDAVLHGKAAALNIAVKSHDEMKKTNINNCQETLKSLKPDVLFSVNNLKYIRKPVLECFPRGCFNLHPGKLPEYGGLHVAQWAIRNGETESAATLHWMNSGIDEGATAYTTIVPIKPTDTGLDLLQACMKIGVNLVLKCIVDLLLQKEIPKVIQDENSFHCYRTKDAKSPYILWKLMLQENVYNFIRAADYGPIESPTYSPTICFKHNKLQLKCKDVELFPVSNEKASPGEVLSVGTKGVFIQCASNSGTILIKSGTFIDGNSNNENIKGKEVGLKLGVKCGDVLYDNPVYANVLNAYDTHFASSNVVVSYDEGVLKQSRLNGKSGLIDWENTDTSSPLVDRVAILLKHSYPIMRSITGNGVRRTHQMFSDVIPLECFEVPSGTQIFDWKVPKEWVFNDAYIADSTGKRIIDAKKHGLHLMNYSTKFKGKMKLTDLQKRLHSIENQPKVIPYCTSYYKETWGFCLSHEDRMKLTDGFYDVVIDTEMKEDGSLTMSEAVLPGQSKKEIFFSAYTCHPHMCNDSLSGGIVAAFLYEALAQIPKEKRRYTYRFAFIPETIGAIAYLKLRGEVLKSNMVAGYVLTCIGDGGYFTYKRSRMGSSVGDLEMVKHMDSFIGPTNPYGTLPGQVRDYWPSGSDERQYCAPAFNLPVGCIARSFYGGFKEYHTSADDLTFVKPEYLVESVNFLYELCMKLEKLDLSVTTVPKMPQIFSPVPIINTPISGTSRFVTLLPFGEPQLGPRGMYYSVGSGHRDPLARIDAIMWLLAYCTGSHTLKEISDFSMRHYYVCEKNHSITDCYKFLCATVDQLVIVAKELVGAQMIKRVY